MVWRLQQKIASSETFQPTVPEPMLSKAKSTIVFLPSTHINSQLNVSAKTQRPVVNLNQTPNNILRISPLTIPFIF